MGQQSMQQYPVLDMIATGARIKALREAQGISPAELTRMMLEEIRVWSPTELEVAFLDGSRMRVKL